MKTYFGVRLPDPGRDDVDTASTSWVWVFTRTALDNGEVAAGLPAPLAHVCRQQRHHRDDMWRRQYPCHSPDGFNWGYGGSGPAELAAMMLLDLDLPLEQVWALHQSFKSHFIARLDDTWALHEEQIREWIAAQGRPANLTLLTRQQFLDDLGEPLVVAEPPDDDMSGQREPH